jgi:ELWxxDGT repeat protein
VKDIAFGSRSGDPGPLVDLGGTLLFGAVSRAHGRELWRSDGTEAGTVRLQDLVPGPISSNPTGFTLSGSRVYFAADDTVTGEELWSLPLSCLPPRRR